MVVVSEFPFHRLSLEPGTLTFRSSEAYWQILVRGSRGVVGN